MDGIAGTLVGVIITLLSLSVHEWAHAAMAVSLGDDTPERQGRYTLNPLPHIDPIGTILLPLFNAPIGWAKPVEWNPARVRRGIPMQRALWLVSMAGPASNIVLALIAAVAYCLTLRFPVDSGRFPIQPLAEIFIFKNVGLAVFNMIPIPPLDGSRIVDALIPRSFSAAWAQIHRFAPFILVLLILAPPVRSLLMGPIEYLANAIFHVALRLVGLGS